MCGDYCVFGVFLRATGAAPQSCFSLLRELGDSTHDRDHCVREMCVSFFGTFYNDGVHVSPLLNQVCKASYRVHEQIKSLNPLLLSWFLPQSAWNLSKMSKNKKISLTSVDVGLEIHPPYYSRSTWDLERTSLGAIVKMMSCADTLDMDDSDWIMLYYWSSEQLGVLKWRALVGWWFIIGIVSSVNVLKKRAFDWTVLWTMHHLFIPFYSTHSEGKVVLVVLLVTGCWMEIGLDNSQIGLHKNWPSRCSN